MEISYKKVGDYYIPEMVFPNAKLDKNIGKYGRLRLNYLKHNHMDIYTILLMDDKLNEIIYRNTTKSKGKRKICQDRFVYTIFKFSPPYNPPLYTYWEYNY